MQDLINRRAAIEALEDAEDAFGYLTKDWREVLEQLPPIQPDNSSENPNSSDTDTISRQAAIDTIEDFPHGDVWNVESMEEMVDRIKQLPPIQPVIIPCDYARACNEATMDKLTSAVAYYDVLEELRKHGYVLVDMREVNHESN